MVVMDVVPDAMALFDFFAVDEGVNDDTNEDQSSARKQDQHRRPGLPHITDKIQKCGVHSELIYTFLEDCKGGEEKG
jgi:hypothetical protein